MRALTCASVTPGPAVRLLCPAASIMRRSARSLGSLLLGFCAAGAFAQSPPGLAVTKTCPPTAPPEHSFACVFTIQNMDPVNPVISLAVTNTVPFPGGTPAAVPCLVLGVPVTTLQPFSTPGDTCQGSVEEISTCGPGDTLGAHDLTDRVAATGTDPSGRPVSGEMSASVHITDCPPPPPTNTPTTTPTPTRTPTPTNSPTNTPTTTPANTPTSTPTAPPAPVPVVPTLNETGLLAFGLLIAAAGLLLLVRRR